MLLPGVPVVQSAADTMQMESSFDTKLTRRIS
jgi:hypothetical protein